MGRPIPVLMAVDEAYVAPLLVTVGSLLEHLRPGAVLDLYLLIDTLSAAARAGIDRACEGRARLHWTAVDTRRLEFLRGCGSPPAASFRLLAGSCLPEAVSKVIYLDADLLVRRDIVALWELDMQGRIVLAVQDSYIQRPRPYFNSGVMVMDLTAWRAAAIEQCCLEAARRLPRRTRWLDQEVLNACLAGHWGAVSPAWNRQFALGLFPDWRCSPYEEDDFELARRHPAIVHFCGDTKPWHAFCDHGLDDVRAYRVALQRVAPGVGRAPSRRQRTVEFFAAPHRRLRDTLAAAVRARHRGHALRSMLPGLCGLAIRHPWTLASVPVSVAFQRAALRLRR